MASNIRAVRKTLSLNQPRPLYAALSGQFHIVQLIPGRCPGLSYFWPFRPIRRHSAGALDCSDAPLSHSLTGAYCVSSSAAASICRSLIVIVIAALSGAAGWAEFVAIPSEIELTHRDALHGILVEATVDGGYAGDRTSEARFTSSDAQVVEVDEAGVVRALANGEATITAQIGEATLAIPVRVTGADAPFLPGFKNTVQPVLFKMGCNTGACHGAAAGKNGFKLSLRGFAHDADHAAITRHATGRRVSLADPESSLLLLKPVMDVPHEGGLRFEKDSEAYRLLRDWLKAGAPAASDAEPRIEKLEMLPADVTLTADAKQQLLVRAHYDDGTYRDVTRWAKFETTVDTVALVDEEGEVQVAGPGAAAITAYYASNVAAARVTVPREAEIAPEKFAEAERFNYIDELVLRQLKRLQIAPAAICDDATFIRRAHLDTLGVLPSPEEVHAFVTDTAADKRARLVDALLDRPEFVDYWAYKWSDLLLLSSKNLPNKNELTAFYDYIRESVATNKAWDAFVADILTATGSTLDNGAANYFVMHKETIDLTETTSQAFLGMSLTCARCHNHPLEKWTQTDYYGMANLFSRVKLKNGEGGGTTVLADPFGDIIHPRLGQPVDPKPLDAEGVPASATSDRREVLANWLASPNNPYFTRAIVNRVWANFMGRGLVEPVDDLRLTNPATNESLFAALEEDLVEHGYDLKHLMRTILTSATYQRSSEAAAPDAPDNMYFSQYIIRRLPAEVLLDVYSQVTGVPTDFAGYPNGFRALQLPDSDVGSYFLTTFGRPERRQTCECERTEDATLAQTLHIANGETLNNKLKHDAAFLTALVTENASDEASLDASIPGRSAVCRRSRNGRRPMPCSRKPPKPATTAGKCWKT
jgi:hypothetical protein